MFSFSKLHTLPLKIIHVYYNVFQFVYSFWYNKPDITYQHDLKCYIQLCSTIYLSCIYVNYNISGYDKTNDTINSCTKHGYIIQLVWYIPYTVNNIILDIENIILNLNWSFCIKYITTGIDHSIRFDNYFYSVRFQFTQFDFTAPAPEVNTRPHQMPEKTNVNKNVKLDFSKNRSFCICQFWNVQ